MIWSLWFLWHYHHDFFDWHKHQPDIMMLLIIVSNGVCHVSSSCILSHDRTWHFDIFCQIHEDVTWYAPSLTVSSWFLWLTQVPARHRDDIIIMISYSLLHMVCLSILFSNLYLIGLFSTELIGLFSTELIGLFSTAQRLRDLDYWLRFEIEDMTLQIQQAVNANSNGVEYHFMSPTPRRQVPFTTGRRAHWILENGTRPQPPTSPADSTGCECKFKNSNSRKTLRTAACERLTQAEHIIERKKKLVIIIINSFVHVHETYEWLLAIDSLGGPLLPLHTHTHTHTRHTPTQNHAHTHHAQAQTQA